MNYVGNARERLVELDTAAVTAMLGADSSTWVPQIVLSPRTSRGLPTSGLALVLFGYPPPNGVSYGTPAQPSAPGFTLTIWRAVPTSPGYWARLQAFTGANFGDQLVLPDISGGMELIIELENVGTPGKLMLGIAELD